MPASTRALPRALLLILALSLAPVAASAATVRYWVPDNPWVQAMLAMMETLGILQPVPPGYGESYSPGGWPGSGMARPGFPGMSSNFGAPGFPGMSSGFGAPGFPGMSNGFGSPGFPGMSNAFGWPGSPAAAMPPWDSGNFWSPPTAWNAPAGRDGLVGLWVSPDGEALWLEDGGFAYRDASGRSLGGRMLRQGNRLLVELEGGSVIAMQYQLRGPQLQILDPQGLVRQFRRVR